MRWLQLLTVTLQAQMHSLVLQMVDKAMKIFGTPEIGPVLGSNRPNREPDPPNLNRKSGSRFRKMAKPDLRFGLRFPENSKEPDRTGLSQH